jgi:hypothetical protein
VDHRTTALAAAARVTVTPDPANEQTIDEVPPRVPFRQHLDRVRLAARRQRWGRLLLVALFALLLGLWIGRTGAPGPGAEARTAVESTVQPIALESDGIWTAGADGRPAVSEGLVAVRREGDDQVVFDNLDVWIEAYDQVLVRMVGVDLPPTARPVQRQFITAVTLSRDAVEVLGHAATVEDEVARRDLTTEVGRLRSRSEQLMQSARASTGDLDGRRTDVSPLPPVRSFLDGRRD